jgi:hypothetical protein
MPQSDGAGVDAPLLTLAYKAPEGLFGIHLDMSVFQPTEQERRELVHFQETERGRHLAALGRPKRFVAELRQAFKSRRAAWGR